MKDPAIDLVNSCINNMFPSMKTMSQFGMDGAKGTNPIDILKCYKTAIKEGKITSEDISNADDINELIMKYNETKQYFERVKKAGGIQINIKIPEHIECSKCNYCGTTPDINICPNCQLKF